MNHCYDSPCTYQYHAVQITHCLLMSHYLHLHKFCSLFFCSVIICSHCGLWPIRLGLWSIKQGHGFICRPPLSILKFMCKIILQNLPPAYHEKRCVEICTQNCKAIQCCVKIPIRNGPGWAWNLILREGNA